MEEFGVSSGRRTVPFDVSTSSKTRTKPLGGSRKRIFDTIISSILLVFFSPLYILVAISIKLCDGGPVFYKHTRIGFLGNPFSCLKFRTMANGAEEKLSEHLAADSRAAAEWAARRKLKFDPRLIRIGAALRRSSLDELPQLINILRGDMSLVGPRPVVAEELAHYGPSAELYLSARPGLTGAWQVGGRSDTCYKRRVEMDRDYCLNWSILGDIGILIKTIPVVIFIRGSC